MGTPGRRSFVLSGGVSFTLFESASLAWAYFGQNGNLSKPLSAGTAVALTIIMAAFGLFFGWLFFRFQRLLRVRSLYAKGVLVGLIVSLLGLFVGPFDLQKILPGVAGSIGLGLFFVWLAIRIDGKWPDANRAES